MTDRLSVDIPDDHVGPIEIEVRRGGAVVATLGLDAGAAVAPQVADQVGLPVSRDDRERQILEIAGDVISAKGFAATSIRDIAKAADISIAALYRHIGSKDELLHRITQTRMQELFDHFETNLADTGSAGERLADAIAVYLAYISKNHRYINLVYRETKVLDPSARERIYATEREFMKLWEGIIAEGVERGEFVEVDTDLAANLAYFACTAWALRFWSIGDRSEAEVRDILTKFVLGGLTRTASS